ncbi:SpdA protein [Sphaerisporangium krabiense]|uniref:DUF2637 domain-containing protein n=1 Tax=Sphaerisporangium krabiense TaxID=763782 RepID=A0A7W8Z3N7_9ACTN|nr:DUF2637 domain-containing protein [Sphaerisporangium krabiense]MBB5626851.1 hypothetical protein [Sphaerisporangium krabiense]GII67350.1 SpdA protein [Sphaerisporangium krabiense]
MRRLASWLLDSGPVIVLALIAGAGSFSHVRQTAVEHGQTGPMAWAVAVCVDLTCVMAARERQRDKKTGRHRTGPLSWPTCVLVAGIILSLAANLHQAEPSVWGWLTAATPAAAFLVAVSMLERRATGPRAEPSPASAVAAPATALPTLLPASDRAQGDVTEPSPALLDYARRVVDEHSAKHGKPITLDLLRARLGVSRQLAADLLHHLRTAPETP